ncbi:MAG: MFS transporter [Leptospirales bacterium]|nr:MFS transporter [Leptospirales bacterium]
MQTSLWAPATLRRTIALLMAITIIAIESFAASVAMPAAVREVGGIGWYGWAFSSFFLAMIAAMAVAGALAEGGAHRPFWLGNVLFALGLLLAGTSSDILIILAGRTLQGFGSGFASAATYAIVSVSFAPQIRARMIALLSSAYAIPAMVGPAWAVLITEQYGWRWVFLILAPFPLFSMLMVKRVRSPTSTGSDPSRSLVAPALLLASGIALASVSVTLFTQGHSSAIPGMILGIILAIPAVVYLLARRAITFRFVFASMVLLNAGFFGVDAILPLLLEITRQAAPFLGGLALTAAALGWIGASWVQSRMVDRFGRRGFVALGAFFVMSGIAVTACSFYPQWPGYLSVVGWGLAGAGMGFASNTLSLLGMEQAGGNAEDVAIVQLSAVIGMAIGTSISAGFQGGASRPEDISLLRVLSMCAVLIAIVIPVPFLAVVFKKQARSIPESRQETSM